MARKPTGEPVGRPQKEINWENFENLCGLQCTSEEMAGFLKIHRETLYDRVKDNYGEEYSTIYKRYADQGKCSLRRNQFVIAKKNATMAIWLGKQYLGQKDLPIETTTDATMTQFNALMSQLLNLQNEKKMEDNGPASSNQ
jgi:hypothetical protein